MNKFLDSDYDYKRSLLFCWPTWVWKTYRARLMIKKYNSESFHEDLRTYEISDAKFKQLVKSNSLNLRKPEDRKTSIKMYPMEMMLKCWILLYDDIWVSDTTEAYIRDLTFMIDERINKWLITIYTSNLNKEELEKRLNERIVSRMMYNTDIIIMDWEDKRLLTTRVFSW